MKMTEMMDSEAFQPIKADLGYVHAEAIPVKGGSAHDMSDSERKLAKMGQQIAAALSPRSSDLIWKDDQQFLDALHFSNALIHSGREDTLDSVIARTRGMDKEKAQAIFDFIKTGNVDITKSAPDPDQQDRGINNLAKAVAKA
tara:strand:- start:1270 stop:1698 length:429 start_codon:yes stop_codon:yes gene_type:complete